MSRARHERPQSKPKLPMPAALQEHLGGHDAEPRDGDNLGLWLDKFVRRDGDTWEFKAGHREAELKRLFCRYSLDELRSWRCSAAAETLARLQAACASFHGQTHRTLVVQVHGRLLVDYGRASAIESSLSMHPILGCPRIPGSALKGMLRASLRDVLMDDPQRLRDLLGAPDAGVDIKTIEAQRGRLVMYDALPEDGEFCLDLDVLTPHARDYYEDKDTQTKPRTPPADWVSPIPFTFLTVVQTRFRLNFGLLPRPEPSPSSDEADLELIEQVLCDGLVFEGIGAKRSAGYGRLWRVEHDQ